MTSLRCPLGLFVILTGLGAVASGCSGSYVGEVESATVVVHGSPPCNVGLTDDGYERHGLDWYSKATVDTAEKLPGTYEGTFTYTDEREAVFEADGIIARFKGKESDEGVTLECPSRSELWNPTEGP